MCLLPQSVGVSMLISVAENVFKIVRSASFLRRLHLISVQAPPREGPVLPGPWGHCSWAWGCGLQVKGSHGEDSWALGTGSGLVEILEKWPQSSHEMLSNTAGLCGTNWQHEEHMPRSHRAWVGFPLDC